MPVDPEIQNLNRRLRAIEDFVIESKALSIPYAEAHKLAIAGIMQRLDHIEAHHNRIFWILLSGIGASAVQFVINGGLSFVHH